MAHDVFISYSSVDKQTADLVCSRIESRGMQCWYAPRNIEPGTKWASSINTAISEAKVMILLFTDDANKSDQVLREVSLAIENNVIVLPIKLTKKKPRTELKYYLKSSHWIDTRGVGISDDDIEKLVQTCEVNVHSTINHPRALKKRSRHSKKMLVAAIALVVLIGLLAMLVLGEFLPSSLAYKLDSQLDGKSVSGEALKDQLLDNLNAIDAKNEYGAVRSGDDYYLLIRDSRETNLALYSTNTQEQSVLIVFPKEGSESALCNNRVVLSKAILKTAYPNITDKQLDTLISESGVADEVGNAFLFLELGDYGYIYSLNTQNQPSMIKFERFGSSDCENAIRSKSKQGSFWE